MSKIIKAVKAVNRQLSTACFSWSVADQWDAKQSKELEVCSSSYYGEWDLVL